MNTIAANQLKAGDVIRIEVYRALDDGTYGKTIENRIVGSVAFDEVNGRETVNIWHTDGTEFGEVFRVFGAGYAVEVAR